MKKIIIAKTIIFFLFQINTAQVQQIISDTISLDGVTLEAIKIPLKEKKALYPISKFNFKNYQFLTPQINISEFLESVPGLFILNNNNYAQDPRISIRGFGSRANFGVRGIKIFVDGIPETSPDGQSQTDNINLPIIEELEVFRGNNSSLFGSSSGGAISITTLEDFEKDFVRFGYSLGSFDTSKSQATIGLANNKQKLVFFISNTKSNGYRTHTEYESFNINFKYIVNINTNNKLQLIGNILNSPRANDPGGLNIEEVKSDRSQGRFRNIQYDAGEKVKQYKVGLNLSSIIRKLKLTNSIYFNQRLFDGKLPFGSGGIVDLNRSFWGYKLNVNFKGLLNYDLGLSYNSQKDDRQRFINDEGIKTDQVMGQYENYENISLYFFGSKNIQRFNLSVGARVENNIISMEGYFNPEEKKIKKINSFNPSINILYELNKIDLFGNFSTGYETPTLNELSATANQSGFNENLKTIKSNTFEFGFANFRTNQTVNYSLRLFNISTSNEITPYQLSDGLVLYRNAGKTIKRGAEIELVVKITDQLNFDYSASVGNYKFESFKFIENDFSNNIMPGIPESNQSIKLSYTNENSYNLLIGLKRVGKMFADNANETEIDGYSTISIRMSKNLKIFKTSMIPFISIDNLLNEEYFDNIRINAFGSRFYEPASGINIVGGLKINL